MVDGHKADFCESLTIYDWLCDRQPDAIAADNFCTIHSLPGVFVSGNGLMMNGDAIAPLISQNPQKFLEICNTMDAKQVQGADLAVVIYPFSNLPMLLKFYDGDEEFAPSLSLLWDSNILQFLRYETIYYLAGCLIHRLHSAL